MTCGLTIVLIILILSLLIPASYVMGMTRGMVQSDSFRVQRFDGSATSSGTISAAIPATTSTPVTGTANPNAAGDAAAAEIASTLAGNVAGVVTAPVLAQCPNCAKVQMCGWNGGADSGDMRVFCNWGSGETYG
jgi:predicted Na+-dependent transporter